MIFRSSDCSYARGCISKTSFTFLQLNSTSQCQRSDKKEPKQAFLSSWWPCHQEEKKACKLRLPFALSPCVASFLWCQTWPLITLFFACHLTSQVRKCKGMPAYSVSFEALPHFPHLLTITMCSSPKQRGAAIPNFNGLSVY
jgi:hypothetical protein